jgi:cyanophycinase
MQKAIFLLLWSFCQLVYSDSPIVRYLVGNPKDVNPPLAGPGLNLAGGSTDVDAGMQWMIDYARGCTSCETKVDVIVIRASSSNAYNDYILGMNGVDSVETLVIRSRKAADQADLEQTVMNAEVVFFAGGDQCNYVKYVKGTRVEKAIEAVYARGGVIGGTSAGCAIMGTVTFDACVDTAYSDVVLKNPYHKTATLTRDFFQWQYLNDTLTDQHFAQRKRLGRLLTFLARQIQDGFTEKILGVGVNERTVVLVDKNGLGTVMGEGPAYFILADHKPEVCKPNTPLTYKDYKIWKIPTGSTFDFKNRPTDGYYLRSVINGEITEDPY